MRLLLASIVMAIFMAVGVLANPVFSPAITNKVVAENSSLSVIMITTAPSSGSTAFLKDVSFGILTKDSETQATFNWTPSFTDAGVYTVNFTVKDSDSQDSNIITITVTNTNRAPTLNAIPAQTVDEFQALSFTISGSDPDGDTLSYYNSTALPAGAVFTPSTRTFTWTPNATQSGT